MEFRSFSVIMLITSKTAQTLSFKCEVSNHAEESFLTTNTIVKVAKIDEMIVSFKASQLSSYFNFPGNQQNCNWRIKLFMKPKPANERNLKKNLETERAA